METKICKKYGCESKGTEQSLEKFSAVPRNTGGYRHVCDACIASGRRLANNQNDIEVLGNDHYIFNSVRYKIINGKLLMIRILDEYVRSSNDAEWLMRKVRLHAQG